MEVLVIMIFVALIFLVSRSSRSGNDGRASGTKRLAQPSSSNIPHAETTKLQPPSFDEESAKQLDEKRFVTGFAYITDGDTIKIAKTQIRLFGIDAPELNHPYGKKAKWALHNLCKGEIVRAEIVDEDDHGRTVAHCYLPDGRDLSAEMVKQGLAIDWPKFSKGKYHAIETPDARKKLFLADARQKGRMYVWERFEAKQGKR